VRVSDFFITANGTATLEFAKEIMKQLRRENNKMV